MFSKLKTEYFPNKYYSGMYAHFAGNQMVNTMVVFLTGPYLYATGLSLPVIFLFYCLSDLFCLFGLINAPYLVCKFESRTIVVVSYILLGFFFLSVILSHQAVLFVIAASIFYGFQKGIYYPVTDTLQASFIDKEKRGKQLSAQAILISFVGILAAFIVGRLLQSSSAMLLLPIILLSIIFALSPFFIVFKEKIVTGINHVRDVLGFVLSKSFRNRLIQTTGLTLVNSILNSVLALYVFIFLKDFKLFSAVIMTGIVLETTATLYMGRLIDQTSRTKGLTITSWFVGLGNFLLLFFGQSALVASLIKVYAQGSFNVLVTAYDANYNDKAQESGKPFLFSLSVLIVMAITGIVLYGICAILSVFIPAQILFAIIFTLSLLGLFINFKFFKE